MKQDVSCYDCSRSYRCMDRSRNYICNCFREKRGDAKKDNADNKSHGRGWGHGR